MSRHSSTAPVSAHQPAPGIPIFKLGRLAAAVAQSRETTLFIVLLLLVGGTALARPEFLNLQNLRDVLLNVAIISLLTAGMTLVMLMRHIDLSISSTLGISAYTVGSLFVVFPNLPVALALVAGVVIGMVAGAINGTLVTFGRVPSLVATLSTLYIYRGADYAWVHGGQINATNLPDAFSTLATGSLLGVPNLVVMAALVLVALAIYLKQFRPGREHYAIGSNPEAAILAGIKVERRVFMGFVLSGAIAGLAGVLWLARFGTVDATTGKGIELQVVAGRSGQRRDYGRCWHGAGRHARRAGARRDQYRARGAARVAVLAAGHPRGADRRGHHGRYTACPLCR
jgi:rhamnose transport system permease protein